MSRDEKTGLTTRDFSKFVNTPLTVEAPDKSIDPELRKDFHVSTESVSIASQVTELEDENRNTSLEKPVENPEIKTLDLKKKHPLPADLREVIDIIRGQKGRITQKDLCSRLKCSEAKVSLMLFDLEKRELIEKFKKGRGNIVILRDEEYQD